MGRNPRPCVCGHVRTGHWPWFQMPCTECHECYRYRPARRTEPLRAQTRLIYKGARLIYQGACPRCHRENWCTIMGRSLACPQEHPCSFCSETFDVAAAGAPVPGTVHIYAAR
jgi:hypothetical protein